GEEAAVERAQPGDIRRKAAVLHHAGPCAGDYQRKRYAKGERAEHASEQSDRQRREEPDTHVYVEDRNQRDDVANEARGPAAPLGGRAERQCGGMRSSGLVRHESLDGQSRWILPARSRAREASAAEAGVTLPVCRRQFW